MGLETNLDNDVKDEDIAKMLELLENFGSSEEGRLKVRTSDEVAQGETTTEYHYGRCDIGSPFCEGVPFDADEALQDVDVEE